MGRSMLTPEQFKASIAHRKDIDVLTEYQGANSPLWCLCLRCDSVFKTNQWKLKTSKECPTCAKEAGLRRSLDARRGASNDVLRDMGDYLEIDVSSEKNPGAIMLIDKEDWERLKPAMFGRVTIAKPSSIQYAVARIGDKQVRVHRWLLQVPDKKVTDHKNGNGLDNRKENIRICTRSENNCNLNTSVRSATGIKGIRLSEYVKKKTGTHSYYVEIKKDGIKHRIGTFKTLAEAIEARLKAEDRYHGDFRFNDIVDSRATT